MRIAIDIRILGKKRTGDETVFFELTRAVLRQDQENTYLLLTNEQDTEKLALLATRLGIAMDNAKQQLIVLGATNRFVWNGWTLPRYLKEAKVDVFHTQYILPFWLPETVRVVNHIHDVSFCAYPDLIDRKDLFFLNLLIPRSLRRSDAIVAPSVFTKNEIIKYYGTDETKIHVIYNALGSDFQTQESSSLTEDALREKYQLPHEYLLYVGTLQPRKNISFLIQALALLRKQIPTMKLVLVGSRSGHHFDQKIDAAIKEFQLEEQVIFPGYVDADDLPHVYQMASVFVFPSLYEGFGIPLLEAMSMRVPAVASKQPCLEEVGGNAALYFELGNVDSLVQILYSLKATEAQKEALVTKGLARVQEFSWQKSGTALVTLYQSVGATKSK